jgi:pantothenate kinase
MFNIDQFERLFRDYCVVWTAKNGRFVSEKRSTACSGQRTLTPGARILAGRRIMITSPVHEEIFVVGLAGASGSGKSTVARRVASRLNGHPSLFVSGLR